jgi:hypothetical protein
VASWLVPLWLLCVAFIATAAWEAYRHISHYEGTHHWMTVSMQHACCVYSICWGSTSRSRCTSKCLKQFTVSWLLQPMTSQLPELPPTQAVQWATHCAATQPQLVLIPITIVF